MIIENWIACSNYQKVFSILSKLIIHLYVRLWNVTLANQAISLIVSLTWMARLPHLFFMILLSPLVFDQEIAFQDWLYHEVVLFITSLKKIFLHDGELCFIYAD